MPAGYRRAGGGVMSADQLVYGRRPPMVTAAHTAERLRVELEQYGVAAEVHEGYGLALVSVWVERRAPGGAPVRAHVHPCPPYLAGEGS